MGTIHNIIGRALMLLILFSVFSCSKDEKDNRLALYGLSAYYNGTMLYRIGEGEVSDSIPVSCSFIPGNGYMELVLDTVPLARLVREAVKVLYPGESVVTDPAWNILYGYTITVKDTGWLYQEEVQIRLYPDTLKLGTETDSVYAALETPGDALYMPAYKQLNFSLVALGVKKNKEELPLPPVQCWFELIRGRSLLKQ